MNKVKWLSTKSDNTPIWTCLSLLAITLLTVLIYANTLNSPFVFDDGNFILGDSAIQMSEISWDAIATAAFESVPKKRILANLSFAFNYYFGEYNVAGYHVVNIAIHLLCAIFILFFVKTTLSLEAASKSEMPPGLSPMAVAALTALLWLAYPVHTGAVTYIVQRMTSLAALFFIISLWLYALGRIEWQKKGGSRRSIILLSSCGLAGICAFATKQNTGSLPLVILLYEFFFFQDLKWRLTRRRAMWLAAGLIIFAAIAIFYLGENPLHRILVQYNNREFTLNERIMTEWRVIIYYLSLFFWPAPWRLNLDYDYPLSFNLTNPSNTILALLAIIGMVILAAYAARRHRIMAFCIFWFLINLLIESSVIGIEIIFEHRTYLPFMMLCLMAVLLIGKIKTRPHLPVALLCMIILGFSLWSYQRNAIWENPIKFWKDSMTKSPFDARPYANIGHEYMKQHRYKNAIPHYESALNLWKNRRLRIEGEKLYFHLGVAYTKTGQLEKAKTSFQNAISRDSKHAKAHYNLAQLFLHKGDMENAALHYEKAIEIEPVNPDARVNLGNIYARKGNYEKATKHYHEALKYNRKLKEASFNLAVAYSLQEKYDMAIHTFKQILTYHPDNPSIYYNIACMHSLKNQPKQAVSWLKKAIENGYTNLEYLKSDPDLDNIRSTKYYRDFIKNYFSAKTN